MNEIFLLDTSILVLAFRRGAQGAWLEELQSLILQKQAAINPVIRMELLTGCRSEMEYDQLNSRLRAIPLLEITETVWQKAGRISFDLVCKGLTLPTVDILIAASAIHSRCILYHSDRHFTLIAQHIPLKIKTF